MNFDDLFYYLNYGRTRKQKKERLNVFKNSLLHKACYIDFDDSNISFYQWFLNLVYQDVVKDF